MSFADRLKERREALGLKQSELGKMLGVTGSAIGNYETGISSPKADVLYRLFDILECDANFLFQDEMSESNDLSLSQDELDGIRKFRALDGHGKDVVRFLLSKEYERMTAGAAAPAPVKRTRVIPLFGTSAAAGPGEPDTGNPFTDYETDNLAAEFAVRITGDSMEPHLRDGQIALCKKGLPDNGDVAVVMVNGSLLCKQARYVPNVNKVFLLSLNRARQDCDYVLSPEKQDTVQCFGTVLLPHKIPPVRL